MGQAGLLAGELLSVLPEIMAKLVNGEWPLQGKAYFEDFYDY